MAKKSIIHPKDNEAVNRRDFAAYGLAERKAHWVKGTLWKDANKTAMVSEGKTIRQPTTKDRGIWVILFENVAQGTGYFLEVTADKDNGPAKAQGITVNRAGPNRQIEITYPGNNATLCTEFVAYGTATSAAHVSGTMTLQSNDKVFEGTTIQQPTERGTWVIRFVDLDPTGAGDSYELVVSNTNGESSNPVTGIKTQQNACIAPNQD